MSYDWRTEWPGVFARHADSCPVRNGHRCTCGPLGYRASARDPQSGRRVLSPDFQTVAEARAWLGDQQESLEAARGVERDHGQLGGLIDEFVEAAENGLVRDRDGFEYPPSAVVELRDSLSYVDAQLGTMRLDDVRRRHVQAMVDELYGSGLDVERIRAVVAALSSLYTYALQRELVDFSPVVQLSLPDGAKGGPQPSMNGQPTQPLPAPAPATAPMATAPMPTAPMATAPMPAALAPAPHHSGMWTPGSLTPPQNPEPYRDALMPERVLWWTVLIIVVVSVLIAIVLAAESV
jgi:hypothetical protein